MQLTFVTDLGHTFVIEIDPSMELENVMALLEAESGVPTTEQSISHEGQELNNPKATMRECGIGENAMLLFRRKVNVAGRTMGQDSEMMRLQLLGDPDLMRQIQETQPEMAAAAQSDPGRFAELLRQVRDRREQTELERQREIMQLNEDPFNVEAQQRIEEAIRQQAVIENMEHALEYSPESFGRVTMLYIPVEVNSKPVKAFVDSGAQQTIMSPDCAEACGIMRLVDRRFAGIARGVGTAKIIGRVHSAQLKLGDLYLPCSFTIMEGRDVDLLLGLDMLKAHQACIDLKKNVLRIQNREVQFLSEHELPPQARVMDAGHDVVESPGAGSSTSGGPSTTSAGHQPQSFPGAGHTLGPSPSNRPRTTGPSAMQNNSPYPERNIAILMDLGVPREVAIRTLDAAGGNVDVAVSLLF